MIWFPTAVYIWWGVMMSSLLGSPRVKDQHEKPTVVIVD